MMPPSLTSTPHRFFSEVPTVALSENIAPGQSGFRHQQTAMILAQSDPDVLADITGAFKTFYESGQIWALIVGLILGYVIRGITTYK